MNKKILAVLAAVFLAMSAAAPAAAAAGDAAQTETAVHSLSEEEFSGLMDFVKEKWDGGKLKSKADILEAIEEGEEKFGIHLEQETEEQLAGVIRKFDELGLSHDAAISLAKELYGKYGDGLAEYAGKLYEEYGDALADNAEKIVGELAGSAGEAIRKKIAEPLEETIKEQVIEPAREAAQEAVEKTAKDFWRDLRDSVVNFFKNIFD